MKKAKKFISIICALVLVASLCCAAPMVSAEDSENTLSNEWVAKNATFSSGSVWSNPQNFADLSNVFFDTLGTNLITDPTVANFADDGSYPEYYSWTTKDTTTPINPDAWWDRPALSWNGFADTNGIANAYASARYSNYIRNDATKSHTADGSGVLVVPPTGRKTKYLPLAPMESYSYYVVTFWLKRTGDGVWGLDSQQLGIRGWSNEYGNANYFYVNFNQDALSAGSWVQCTFLVYTGSKSYSQPAISIPDSTSVSTSDTTYYFDDFGMYKLDAEYGAECMTAGYMLPTDMSEYPTEATQTWLSRDASYNFVNYENVDWSKYGKNVFTDSTVSRFVEEDDELYYADYYDAMETNAQASKVKNPLAMWDKPADDYQFNETQKGNSGASANFLSVNDRGFVTSDTQYSHTDDGSGAVRITPYVNPDDGAISYRNAFVCLPQFDKYSYYVVTLWMKNEGTTWPDNNDWTNVKLTKHLYEEYPGYTERTNDGVNTEDGWHRITFMVYTGTTAYSRPNLYFNHCNNLIIDELEVWKLNDIDFAAECMYEKRLIVEGDCNSDFILNSDDLVAMRRELLSGVVASLAVSDLNDDGVVDLLDFIRLKKSFIG